MRICTTILKKPAMTQNWRGRLLCPKLGALTSKSNTSISPKDKSLNFSRIITGGRKDQAELKGKAAGFKNSIITIQTLRSTLSHLRTPTILNDKVDPFQNIKTTLLLQNPSKDARSISQGSTNQPIAGVACYWALSFSSYSGHSCPTSPKASPSSCCQRQINTVKKCFQLDTNSPTTSALSRHSSNGV
jgi:hypothetical protein